MAPFSAAKPQMRNDYTRCFALNIEVHIQCATRLPPGHAQVEATHRKDRPGGKKGVTVVSIMPLKGRPGHRRKACGIGQLCELVALGIYSRPALHLLQADDVGAQLFDDPAGAPDVATTIQAETPVNVVRRYDEGSSNPI
jgi:hypothetical protein